MCYEEGVETSSLTLCSSLFKLCWCSEARKINRTFLRTDCMLMMHFDVHISTSHITLSPDNFIVLIPERFYCLTFAQSQFDVDLFLSIVAWASKRDEIRHLTAT
jgi:hypothetical protein